MIIKKESIRDQMLDDIELVFVCWNEDTFKWCSERGLDIYDFVDYLN